MLKSRTMVWMTGAILALGGAGSARANLIFVGQAGEGMPVRPLHRTGFGTVMSVLALHETGPGQDGTESGRSFVNATGALTNEGDIGPSPQSLPIAIGDIITTGEILDPSELGIVYNLSETGSNPTNTLTDLAITIYGPAGESLFTAIYAGPDLTLAPVGGNGLGTAGYLFKLDAAQAAAAAPFFVSGNFLGASATISGVDGGNEDFFLEDLVPGDVGGPGVPEPASLVLIASGALVMVRRGGRQRPEAR